MSDPQPHCSSTAHVAAHFTQPSLFKVVLARATLLRTALICPCCFGSGKYGVKAIWMDESEPDHKGYISGGQWDLYAGTDAEVLPAWVHCAPLSS